MFTDEEVIDRLRESFDADTRMLSAPAELSSVVRTRLGRRRAGRLALAGTAGVAAAAIIGTGLGAYSSDSAPSGRAVREEGSAVVSPPSGRSGPVQTVQLSAFEFKVPASAAVTKTCLPGSDAYAHTSVVGEVFELVTKRRGGIATTSAGNPCVGATFEFTQAVPTVLGKVVTSGQPTVFITKPKDPGTRTGYVFLSGRDSLAAASAVGGPSGAYAVVMTIPDDNDQAVLVAGLRQYHPGGR